MAIKHPHNLEYIEWIDSVGPDGWCGPMKAAEVAIIRSVGWISSESKISLVVTCHQDIEGEMHHADMMIPKCAIKQRKVLKYAHESKANKNRKAKKESVQGKV